MSTPITSMIAEKMFNSEVQKGMLSGLQLHIISQLLKAGPDGMTTRQLADLCDISIYTARHWLLKLEEQDYIKKENDIKGYKWIYTHNSK